MARPTNRRQFIKIGVAGATSMVVGCGEDDQRIPFGGLDPDAGGTDEGDDDGADDGDDGDDGADDGHDDGGTDGGDDGADDDGSDESSTGEIDWDCDDPFEGGEYLGNASFIGEGDSYIGQKSNSGRDARLALDLSLLTEDNLLTANEDFFIRTEFPNLLDPSDPFSIQVHGLVGTPMTIPVEMLSGMEQTSAEVMLECSGNGDFSAFGLMSAAEWSGVPLSAILDMVSPTSAATRVLISGFDDTTIGSTHSDPGASWIFTFEDLEDAGAFLATHMNGQPLPPDHGAPVRLICPRWYGCCNIKWVNEIELVDDGALSTSQMREFASRTHQTAAHTYAKDYKPAIMQQAAMPVRVEKWRVNGTILYKVVGIMWGGSTTTEALAIRFDGGPAEPIEVCPPHLQNKTWTLWSYAWQPPGSGQYQIDMEITDPGIPTNRLDSGFYRRWINIDEV